MTRYSVVRGKPCHSRKPDEFYRLVELVHPGPRLELFARRRQHGWDAWGDEADPVVPAMANP